MFDCLEWSSRSVWETFHLQSYSTHSLVTVYGVSCDTYARFHDVRGRLLQLSLDRGSKYNCQVLNAAARVVSATRKCDRGLTQLLYADLHWQHQVQTHGDCCSVSQDSSCVVARLEFVLFKMTCQHASQTLRRGWSQIGGNSMQP